jgi:hypothetical protein
MRDINGLENDTRQQVWRGDPYYYFKEYNVAEYNKNRAYLSGQTILYTIYATVWTFASASEFFYFMPYGYNTASSILGAIMGVLLAFLIASHKRISFLKKEAVERNDYYRQEFELELREQEVTNSTTRANAMVKLSESEAYERGKSAIYNINLTGEFKHSPLSLTNAGGDILHNSVKTIDSQNTEIAKALTTVLGCTND